MIIKKDHWIKDFRLNRKFCFQDRIYTIIGIRYDYISNDFRINIIRDLDNKMLGEIYISKHNYKQFKIIL